MEKGSCIWDDLANPKNGLNLVQTACSARTLAASSIKIVYKGAIVKIKILLITSILSTFCFLIS